MKQEQVTQPTAEQLHYHIALGLFIAVNFVFQRKARRAMVRELEHGNYIDMKLQMRRWLKSSAYSKLADSFFSNRDVDSEFTIAFNQYWETHLLERLMLDADGFYRVLELFEDAVSDMATSRKSKHYHNLYAVKHGKFPTPPASLSLAA